MRLTAIGLILLAMLALVSTAAGLAIFAAGYAVRMLKA